MAIRLRYLAHDLEIPIGEFVIGRTPECQLSIDDPLVSRKHALLLVQRTGVYLHDIGSRNGVFVNGRRVTDPVPLRDGDVIKVGDQQMTLEGIAAHLNSLPPSSSRVRTVRDLRPLTNPEITERPAPAGAAHDLVDLDSTFSGESDFEEMTDITGPSGKSLKPPASHPDKRVTALGVIGSVADKAFALGNIEEAERILARPLADVRTRAEQGQAVEPVVAERALSYAARLATATGKGAYVDYAFVFGAALAMVLPAKVVEELYTALRKVKQADRPTFLRYAAVLREIGPTLRPAERFLQQRIEALERWFP
jgi:FHA domain